jgi:hypothetical protein
MERHGEPRREESGMKPGSLSPFALARDPVEDRGRALKTIWPPNYSVTPVKESRE